MDAAALSGKFHVVVNNNHNNKNPKKPQQNTTIYLSSEYILHFEAFLPSGITESLTEAEKVSYSCVTK